MRQLTKVLLAAGLAAMCVSLAIAQRQPGGQGRGQQISEAQLLNSKKVQDELKLTDAEKEKITKLAEKRRELFKDAKGDFAKVQEEMKKATDEVIKELKPEQSKRLKQITLQAGVQFGGPRVFAREEVQSELKLTDKQKDLVKTSVDDVSKDSQEIMKGINFQDREKFQGALEKVNALNKEANDKIIKSFSADQTKTWNEMLGAKIELKREDLGGTGGGNFGRDKGKGKDKKKAEDK